MPLNLTAEERIAKASTVDDNGCWLWLKYKNPDGYGTLRYEKVRYLAHRFSYMTYRGPIPDGLALDHLCRVRSCVNPDHLEPVTWGTNLIRGDGIYMVAHRENICLRGHPLEGDNLSARKDGRRRCKICTNDGARARRARRNNGG